MGALGSGNNRSAPWQKPEFLEKLGQEWWRANRVGGYCATTNYGINSRKYHGLLIASPQGNPSSRYLLWSKLEEKITIGNSTFNLSSNCYPGTIHPDGWKLVHSCEAMPTCTKTTFRLPYNGKHIEFVKQVWPVEGENATIVKYSFPYSLTSPKELQAEFTPLITFRDVHSIGMPKSIRFRALGTGFEAAGPIQWGIKSDVASFSANPLTYYNLTYPLEIARRDSCQENMFSPGTFKCTLSPGESALFAGSTSDTQKSVLERGKSLDFRGMVFEKMLNNFHSYLGGATPPSLDALFLATSEFIVKGEGHHMIVAGYPYFGVWGRDTFISLPGLCIYTGRHALARDIFKGQLKCMKNGLLPNLFGGGGKPVYESADPALWAIWALWHLDNEGGLETGWLAENWKAIRSLAMSFLKGNSLARVDYDGLVILLSPRATWMDAKVRGKPVTPRGGKRVEINALWIFSLNFLSKLAQRVGDGKHSKIFKEAAINASLSFGKFFLPSKGYFADGIEPIDASLRPNQLFALSLPNIPITLLQARSSLTKIREKLLTPFGLRTLSPDDENYRPHYRGSMEERDLSYHQGTVWPWLLGAYADAVIAYLPHRKKELENLFSTFLGRQVSYTFGTLPEVYDATTFNPGGCPSQAWSVAEVLRACIKIQREKPKWK